ncbi:MAG: Crp/Fnr family transcriptional regulator [candidate division Zixibacteria bacterium]|nr:Crp/Fnr family transcriptional regulator [candidate division Zixibacteria bacterium]
MDKETLLHDSYLCHDLDVDELEAVASIAVLRTVVKGELLFLQGDTATGFYVLLNGRVRLYKSSLDGKEYTLHHIKPGQIFAEVAIFRGKRFPANCVAQEDTTVAFFPKDDFLRLLKKSPELALKIIASLSSFLRDFNRQLEELSLKEVPGRIASFILNESEQTGKNTITLDTSKTELATRLGTISETLSRNLRKLQDNNIITVDRDKIAIRDKNRLSAIADGEKI